MPAYTVRPPTERDVPAVIELVYATELAIDAEARRITPDEVAHDWRKLDLATDAWVVESTDGLVGYALLTPHPGTGRLYVDAYVDPAHEGTGIGSLLLRHVDQRAARWAAEPADTRLVLTNYLPMTGPGEAIMAAFGYQLVRVHHRMFRELTDLPEPEPLPAGVRVRSCDGSDEDLRRVHQCIEDAFTDHWGRARRDFAEWSDRMLYQGFDPSLWLVAERDGQPVGVSLARVNHDLGEVSQLGVLRPDRRLGLGRGLLLRSFAQFAERGLVGASLGVDSTSLTGAQRLYEAAGMRVAARFGRYERELRPGRDLLAEQIAAARAAAA